jgi:Enoyl-CoA hydratase/isomerase
MQQAYRILRVVAEAQTIRMMLSIHPHAPVLEELSIACASLNNESSSGIKAVVLDFTTTTDTTTAGPADAEPGNVEQARVAIQSVAAPVLAVVRGNLSQTASTLVQATDLTLVAHNAIVSVEKHPYSGVEALRLGLITWSVPASQLDSEMERILTMLRENSAIALRHTKASIRLGSKQVQHVVTPLAGVMPTGRGQDQLAALQRINTFYLAHVMHTEDAAEGLQAFLEKRKPQWKNR